MEELKNRAWGKALIVFAVLMILTGLDLKAIEYFLFRGDFQKAMQANEADYRANRINTDQYTLNKAYIELFMGNVEDACGIFSLSGYRLDMTRRESAALMFHCGREEFLNLMGKCENRDKVFPLYHAIYLIENKMHDKASILLSRLNINRLSDTEYKTYLLYYLKLLIKAGDTKSIAGLIRSSEDAGLADLITDTGLLEAISLYDIPERERIINRVLKHYYENRMVDEGISYINTLYGRGLITHNSYRELKKSFLNMPVYILMNLSYDSKSSEYEMLAGGIREYFSRMGRKISLESQDSRLIRYELTDRDTASRKSRFYIPVSSSFNQEGGNIIQPVISLRDKAEYLIRHDPLIAEERTLVILRDWEQKPAIFNLLKNCVFKADTAGYLTGQEKEQIRYIVIDGSAEEIFIVLNEINWISLENIRQIYLLNDMGSYASRLKGFRYREILTHMPLLSRINDALKEHGLYEQDKYYLLGYDIGGIIDMIEKSEKSYSGIMAEYYIHDGRLSKRLKYEKLD